LDEQGRLEKAEASLHAGLAMAPVSTAKHDLRFAICDLRPFCLISDGKEIPGVCCWLLARVTPGAPRLPRAARRGALVPALALLAVLV